MHIDNSLSCTSACCCEQSCCDRCPGRDPHTESKVSSPGGHLSDVSVTDACCMVCTCRCAIKNAGYSAV